MRLFPIYSISKSLSAAAVVAMGIELSARVGDVVDVPAPFRECRLGGVLSHRAGIPDYGGWAEYRDAITETEPWSFGELMDRASVAGVGPQGEFRYSNVGYAIVRRILETVSGSDYFGAINSALLGPLGITDVAPFADRSDWAACVESDVEVSWYHPGWVLTGTIAASPSATEAAFRGILGGRLFDPSALLHAIAVDAPSTVLPEPGYAHGLMTSGVPNVRYAGHGGGGPGYTTFVLATADGKAAAATFEPRVTEQNALILECLRALSA